MEMCLNPLMFMYMSYLVKLLIALLMLYSRCVDCKLSLFLTLLKLSIYYQILWSCLLCVLHYTDLA